MEKHSKDSLPSLEEVKKRYTKLVLDLGFNQGEVAKILGISIRSVRNHIKDIREDKDPKRVKDLLIKEVLGFRLAGNDERLRYKDSPELKVKPDLIRKEMKQ